MENNNTITIKNELPELLADGITEGLNVQFYTDCDIYGMEYMPAEQPEVDQVFPPYYEDDSSNV